MAITPPTRHPITGAAALPLDRDMVARCLDVNERPSDATFATAFERTLAALDVGARRGALGGFIGHVAESVVEVVLEDLGWTPVWHFVGPGPPPHPCPSLPYEPTSILD